MDGQQTSGGTTIRTRLSTSNPFGYDRYGYLWETLANDTDRKGRHLDLGSYDGIVPTRLLQTGVVGSAVAADLVDVASNFAAHPLGGSGPPPELKLIRVEDSSTLPFPDESFHSASLLDVLEHVADQSALLAEVHRVLKPSGLLVVTVPRAHWCSFLDSGNWKFRFPRAHRAYYSFVHSSAEYDDRYRNPASGLVGDIEVAKSWHEHFTPRKLVALLAEEGFHPYSLDGAGWLARPLGLIRFAAGQAGRWMEPAMAVDAKLFQTVHLFSASKRG